MNYQIKRSLSTALCVIMLCLSIIVGGQVEASELQDVQVSSNGWQEKTDIIMTATQVPTQVDNIIIGDLNGDETVNSTDLALLKRYVLNIIVQFPIAQGFIAADVDGDGSISSTDLALIKKYLLDIIDKFPVETILTTPTLSPAITPTPTPVKGIIGHMADGTLSDGVAPSYYNATRYQASEDMNVNQIKVRISKAGTGEMKCAIYADSDTDPGLFLVGTEEKSNLGLGWQTFNLTSPLVLKKGNYYWLASWRNSTYEISSTSSTGCNWWGKLAYSSNWPDTLPSKGGASDFRHSLYALYDPTVIYPTSIATPTVKPTPTSTNTPTPTVKPTPTSTATSTPTVKPTSTSTNTPTPTVKPTSTSTNTPTPTVKPTPTSTATSTPTVKPTSTSTTTPTSTTKPTSVIPQKSQLAAGTNLSGICDWSTEIPFKNLIKMARMWNNTNDHGLTLDSNGYPMKLNGKVAYLIYDRGSLPSLSDMVGDFVLLYDGEGSINIKGTGITNVVKTPGRITYTNTSGKTFTIEITSINESNYIKNMSLVKKEYESNYKSDPFVPNFINKIVNKFNTLRFMDWQRTNDSKQINWSDRHTPETYTWASTYNGGPVPVEVMVDLCNRTGTNAWFCMPHLATDDYIKKFATYVKHNLNPDLKVYIEFSNECWNWQFSQATWCAKQGELEGINAYQYYGKMSARMFDLWKDVFGNEATRIVRVLGAQAGYGNAGQAKYVMDYTLPNGSKLYSNADAIAIAPYFSHGHGGTDNFAFYSPTTPVSTVLADCEADILNKVGINIRNHKKLIDERGNNDRGVKLDLIAYEGGQHLSPYGQTEFVSLYTEANRDPYMGTLYTKYLDVWRKEGGKLFVNFSDISTPGKHGMWGILEHMDQTTTPKYDALLNWIKNNPRWW